MIDDEQNCLKMLEWELKTHCPEVEIVRTCNTGKAGLKAIMEESPDLVFMDIEMPYLNGFEVLELIPEITFDLIFVTAYDQFAVKAFKSSATDYLLKPVDGEDLRRAVDKVLQRQRRSENTENIRFLLKQIEDSRNGKVERIAIPTTEGIDYVKLEEIIYCESDNNYCTVWLKNGNKLVVARSIKSIEEMIDADFFFRTHNRYLVNLREVSSYNKIDGGYLVLSNGNRADVARSRKTRLLESLSGSRV